MDEPKKQEEVLDNQITEAPSDAQILPQNGLNVNKQLPPIADQEGLTLVAKEAQFTKYDVYASDYAPGVQKIDFKALGHVDAKKLYLAVPVTFEIEALNGLDTLQFVESLKLNQLSSRSILTPALPFVHFENADLKVGYNLIQTHSTSDSQLDTVRVLSSLNKVSYQDVERLRHGGPIASKLSVGEVSPYEEGFYTILKQIVYELIRQRAENAPTSTFTTEVFIPLSTIFAFINTERHIFSGEVMQFTFNYPTDKLVSFVLSATNNTEGTGGFDTGANVNMPVNMTYGQDKWRIIYNYGTMYAEIQDQLNNFRMSNDILTNVFRTEKYTFKGDGTTKNFVTTIPRTFVPNALIIYLTKDVDDFTSNQQNTPVIFKDTPLSNIIMSKIEVYLGAQKRISRVYYPSNDSNGFLNLNQLTFQQMLDKSFDTTEDGNSHCFFNNAYGGATKRPIVAILPLNDQDIFSRMNMAISRGQVAIRVRVTITEIDGTPITIDKTVNMLALKRSTVAVKSNNDAYMVQDPGYNVDSLGGMVIQTAVATQSII